MIRVTSLLPVRAARSAVVAAFLLGLAAPQTAAAQEEAPQPEATAPDEATPPAEPAATDPAAAPAADAAAPAAAAEPLETIPVETAEAAPADESPRYPYNSATARLRHTEFDASATDGIGIEGSYLLLPNVYAIGALTLAQADDAGSTKSTLYEIGAGYRQEFMAGMDLNVALRVIQDDINSEPQSEVEMGLRADVGVRKQVLPQLEGGMAVSYVERSRSARGVLSATALYELSPGMSVGAEVVGSSNSVAYGLLGRWAF